MGGHPGGELIHLDRGTWCLVLENVVLQCSCCHKEYNTCVAAQSALARQDLCSPVNFFPPPARSPSFPQHPPVMYPFRCLVLVRESLVPGRSRWFKSGRKGELGWTAVLLRRQERALRQLC